MSESGSDTSAITLGLHAAHQPLLASAADLSALTIARNALAASLPFESGSGRMLDTIERIVTLPDQRTLNRRMSTPDGKYGLAYFAALFAIPGVVIKGHAPTDQQTQASLAKTAA